jgi:hypothetical protein
MWRAIALAAALLPSLMGGQSHAPSQPIPDGWYVYPEEKLKNLDETTLRCFNYSHNEWQVMTDGNGIRITKRVTQEKGAPPSGTQLPRLLKHEEGMPGRTVYAGLRSATHFSNGWLLAYDAGEWGGGLWITLSNTGTLKNTGTILNDSTSTLTNSGTLNNLGTISNSGTFTNSGAVTISKSGFFSTSTNYTQTAGSTEVNGTLTATGGAFVDIQGGSLSGTGVLNGNVLMGGTMMPGDAPGTLTIFGNYEQTDTGTFDELIGPLSSSLLNVNGNVTLDPGSSLEITLLNGFDPLGKTFGIMDYQNLSGEFVNGSAFWDDGFLWDVSYGQNQIDVTAVKAPEPETFPLIGVGLIGLLICSWLLALSERSSCSG